MIIRQNYQTRTCLINNYPLNIYTINNNEYIVFNNLFYIISNFDVFYKRNIGETLKTIDKRYIYREAERGCYSTTFINQQGVIAFLQKTRRFSISEKQDIYFELRKCNFITQNITICNTRTEIEFASLLNDILKCKNKKLIQQKEIVLDGKHYAIDMTIEGTNFAIEYDENDHKSYNQNLEIEREKAIKHLGYNLLRISSEHSHGVNLYKVLNFINLLY